MTGTFAVGARPRPYLLPRLRVTGDLVRYAACPLRYRLHAIGGWPEADADAAPRLAGTLVHAALDHAGTACRPVVAGGEGLAVDEAVVARALGVAWRHVDAVSPRLARPPDLQSALERAAGLARRTILELGPHLFPHLVATERRLAATRQHVVEPGALPTARDRLRKVERFEVSGILDAVATVPVRDATGSDPVAALLADVPGTSPGTPIDVVIDYKLARRPGPGGDAEAVPTVEDAHAFQVAAYACLRNRFGPGRPQVGLVIYLPDLFGSGDGRTVAIPGDDPGAARTPGPGADARASLVSRLRRAAAVVSLDDATLAAAAARIDRLGAAIESCYEREAASVPPRMAWPTRATPTCRDCDVRPACPAWQDAPFPGGDGRGARSSLDATIGEPDDA